MNSGDNCTPLVWNASPDLYLTVLASIWRSENNNATKSSGHKSSWSSGSQTWVCFRIYWRPVKIRWVLDFIPELGWGLRIPARVKLKWSRNRLTMYSYKRLFSQDHFNSCSQSVPWGTQWTDENTEAEKFHRGLWNQSPFHLFNKHYWTFIHSGR